VLEVDQVVGAELVELGADELRADSGLRPARASERLGRSAAEQIDAEQSLCLLDEVHARRSAAFGVGHPFGM